ncbi:MAG: PaaI family thioesterase [Hyphomicrobiaceae bacterium]|nr:PaaI family thioesterase [Hyphomicrobiaceae bacterium]
MTGNALTIDDANAVLAENFAPWVKALDMRVDAISTTGATLRIPFSQDLCRVGGIMCGQSLASGSDTAMVLALAGAMGGLKPLTTVDLTINFMRAVTKSDAVLEAKVMRLGRTLAFCTCEIREAGSDKPAAFSTGTYAVL